MSFNLDSPPRRAGIRILVLAVLLALPAAAGAQSPPPGELPAPEAADAPDASPGPGPGPTAGEALADQLALEAERTREFLSALNREIEEEAAAARAEAARNASATERIAGLALELGAAPPRGPQVDSLYDLLFEELKEARARLRRDLDPRRTLPESPRYRPGLAVDDLETPSVAATVAGIRKLQSEIERARSRLDADRRETRWITTTYDAGQVDRLNGLLIQSLEKLSPKKRRKVLGVTREGLAQLRGETELLILSTRYYLADLQRQARWVPSLWGDFFNLGSALLVFLEVAVILGLALLARRNLPRLMAELRRLREPARRGIPVIPRTDGLLGAIEAMAPWLLYLATLRILQWALGAAADFSEAVLLYRIGLLYGLYRLAIALLFSLSVSAAGRYRLPLDPDLTLRLADSVRTLLRAAVGILALLLLSDRFLGRGYLFHLVERGASLAMAGAVLLVLGRWRETIADAYLRHGPPGRLADLVRRSRERWYGMFLAPASFGWLAGKAAVVVARDFALGFDQTRKALAFLFRRKIEKHAERQGYAAIRLDALPPALVRVFSPAAGDGPWMVPYFPGLEGIQAALRGWREGGPGGSLLLIGEQGMGKTSWIGRLEADGLPVHRVGVPGTVTTVSDLARLLSGGIDAAGDPDGDLRRVQRSLLDAAPRVVALDGGSHLFLRALGGYQALDGMLALVEATSHRVFWICSCNTFGYEHLSAIRPDLAVFRTRQILPPWTEKQIRELIRARTSGSGVSLVYDDLVENRAEWIDSEAFIRETEEGYLRLLWDYSAGNPGVALHFWLRSLVPESPERARVRLFRAPDPAVLEDLGEGALFLLASVMVHGGLTLESAAAVSGDPPRICRVYLDRLRDLEVLHHHEGHYRIAIHWLRAATRLLQRKNLLAD